MTDTLAATVKLCNGALKFFFTGVKNCALFVGTKKAMGNRQVKEVAKSIATDLFLYF